MIARLTRAVLGLLAAALAGGLALGGEIAMLQMVEPPPGGSTPGMAALAGLMSGLYAALFFLVGLLLVGLPTLWGLARLRRLNAVTAAVAGGVGSVIAVVLLMLLSEVTDGALAYALYLALPGGLAGWLLWRIIWRPV